MSRNNPISNINGIPLHASPNAGRVRADAGAMAWLVHGASGPADRTAVPGTTGMVMPDPSNEVNGVNGEAEGSVQLPANELPAAPSLLQRAATGTTGVLSTPVTQSTNQQQPQFISAAQPNKPNAAVSSPWDCRRFR